MSIPSKHLGSAIVFLEGGKNFVAGQKLRTYPPKSPLPKGDFAEGVVTNTGLISCPVVL